MWVSVPPVEVTMANTGEQNHLRCSQPLKPHTEWKDTTRDPQETCTHLYGHLEARWDNSENLMSVCVPSEMGTQWQMCPSGQDESSGTAGCGPCAQAGTHHEHLHLGSEAQTPQRVALHNPKLRVAALPLDCWDAGENEGCGHPK